MADHVHSGTSRLLAQVVLGGLEVQASPWLLRNSRELVLFSGLGVPVLLVWSLNVFNQLLAGVHWHDDDRGCPTWTDAAGCRCDLGEAA